MGTLPSIAVVVAGLSSGAIFGATIKTQPEWIARKGSPGWQPFHSGRLVGIVLNQLFWLLVAAAATGTVCVVMLRFANVYPLLPIERQALGISWLLGTAISKYARDISSRRRRQIVAACVTSHSELCVTR